MPQRTLSAWDTAPDFTLASADAGKKDAVIYSWEAGHCHRAPKRGWPQSRDALMKQALKFG